MARGVAHDATVLRSVPLTLVSGQRCAPFSASALRVVGQLARRATPSNFRQGFEWSPRLYAYALPCASLAIGLGHPPKSLTEVRRTEPRSAKIDRPNGVIRSFQVSLNNVEPSERVIVCNLLAKDDVRATLSDELGPDGPEVSFVGEALAEASDAERLAWARARPDLPIVDPACGAESVGPDADAGEEVTLIVLPEVRGFNFDDAAFIHVSFCDVSGLAEIPQPLRRIRLDLVVVGGHLHPLREARVLPLARVQLGVGRTLAVRADAQQRPERGEREEPAVETERELVQVGLEMLRRDAVVNTQQPRLEVREHEVDQGEPFFRHIRIAILRDRLVLEVVLLERVVGAPVVRNDVRAQRDGHPGEAYETLGWFGRERRRDADAPRTARPGAGWPCAARRRRLLGRWVPGACGPRQRR